jgi:carbonic anhydrase/acetyltransferase-like protein (isoleucine patch superfamily)
VIPPRSLVLGVPGRVVRTLSPKEAAVQRSHAMRYAALAAKYKRYLG